MVIYELWSYMIMYNHSWSLWLCKSWQYFDSFSFSFSFSFYTSILFDSYHIISFILIFDLFCLYWFYFLFYNFSFLFLTLNIITSNSFFSSFWGQYDSIRLHVFHLLYSTLFYPTSLYSTLSYLITPYLISIWSILIYSLLFYSTRFYSVLYSLSCH